MCSGMILQSSRQWNSSIILLRLRDSSRRWANLSATWLLTSKLRYIPGPPGLLFLWCRWWFLFGIAYTGGICVGFASSKIWKRSANFALISSELILTLISSTSSCICHRLDSLILPLGFLLVSRMLTLKHLIIIQLSYTVRIPIFWLVDLYHVTLGYDATTSLTSLSWCNSRGVNSIHHCHYTMALADSKFDDFCLQCIQFE